jgi:hypothetical protein
MFILVRRPENHDHCFQLFRELSCEEETYLVLENAKAQNQNQLMGDTE